MKCITKPKVFLQFANTARGIKDFSQPGLYFLYITTVNYLRKKINKTTDKRKKYNNPDPFILISLAYAMENTNGLQNNRNVVKIGV
jgi:hypothetical protein